MSESILRRELAESRRSEERYRARVERSASLSRRLHAHAQALRALVDGEPSPSRVEHTLGEIAVLSGKALEVGRSSIWLFDDGRANLVRHVDSAGGAILASERLAISTSTCPEYVAAITSEAVLAVENTTVDPRLVGLQPYLRQHGVHALLDIAIAVPGGISGVVCLEHGGGPRRWEPEEIEFGTAVALFIGLALEASRRILAERRAAALDAKYRHLVESLPVALYSFDIRTGRLDYVSPRVEGFGGWRPTILEKREGGALGAWLERVVPEDRAQIEERFRTALTHGLTPEIVYRVDAPDGRRRWIRDSCAVVRGHAGDPIAVQGLLADVTDLKEAERRTVETERRFASLLQSSSFLGVIVSADGEIEYVNDAVAGLLERDAAAMVGEDWFDAAVPAREREGGRARLRESIAGGFLDPRREGELAAKSGPRSVLWSDAVMRTPAGEANGRASIGLDVTDRALLERAAAEEAKTDSLGRLAASIAHDFNNMLAVISAGLDDLGEGSATTPLAHLRGALAQATDLTRALLTYARREALVPSLIVIDDLLREMQPVLVHLLARDLRFEEALGAGTARVEIAATHVRQVIVNLVTNASEAMRDQGTTVRLSTSRRLLDTDEARALGLVPNQSYIVVTVRDDGPGMPPEVLARASEAFFTTKRGGTGIGLAASKQIAIAAGGSLEAESPRGEGATLRLYLPEADPKDTVGRGPASLPAAGRTVLVVDDEPILRSLVARILSDAGYDVITAACLAEATVVFAGAPIDLLVIDEQLPDGSGADFTASIRAAHPSLLCLLVSGDVVGDAPGFHASLPKPFRRDTLVGVVRGLLPSP